MSTGVLFSLEMPYRTQKVVSGKTVTSQVPAWSQQLSVRGKLQGVGGHTEMQSQVLSLTRHGTIHNSKDRESI